jgi:hypothetical protein
LGVLITSTKTKLQNEVDRVYSDNLEETIT